MTDTAVPTQSLSAEPPTVNPAANSESNTRANFAAAPMTGDEYIESLRDGREVYLHGERVDDVTTHPAFRNPVRMTARLYDALHTGPYV